MTPMERESLIRTYLEGSMSSDEEHEFFIDVALNAELRTELKAYRTVESAIRKDREIDAGDILQLERSVMAALASTAPAGRAPRRMSGLRRAGYAGALIVAITAIVLLTRPQSEPPAPRQTNLLPTAVDAHPGVSPPQRQPEIAAGDAAASSPAPTRRHPARRRKADTIVHRRPARPEQKTETAGPRRASDSVGIGVDLRIGDK
jgi:hypothetical protein